MTNGYQYSIRLIKKKYTLFTYIKRTFYGLDENSRLTQFQKIMGKNHIGHIKRINKSYNQ